MAWDVSTVGKAATQYWVVMITCKVRGTAA